MADEGKRMVAGIEIIPVIKRTGRAERLAVAKEEDIGAEVVERYGTARCAMTPRVN